MAVPSTSGFVRIFYPAVHELSGLLISRLPRSAMILNVFRLYMDNYYSENVKTTFYAYKANIKDDEDAFIVAVQKRKFYEDDSIEISTPDTITKDMLESFESLIDWDKKNLFAANESIHSTFLLELCKKHGEVKEVDPCHFYYMDTDDALDLEFTTDDTTVEVKELNPTDSETVTADWQYSSPGTQETMKDAIITIGSAGVYVDSKLVSWIVASAVGSMISLFTKEGHTRKGYAELSVKACSKYSADKGLVPNMQIQLKNSASKKLAEKIGFLYSHDIDWINYSPKSMD